MLGFTYRLFLFQKHYNEILSMEQRTLEQLGIVHGRQTIYNELRHMATANSESKNQESSAIAEQEEALSAIKLQQFEHNKGAIEIQALALRMGGKTYHEIGEALEVGIHTAKKLVKSGTQLLVDEDPQVQLQLHQARIEGLIGIWYGLATGETERPLEPTLAMSGDVVEAPAHGTDRKTATTLTIQLLALQQRLASWADRLPRRGSQANGEEEFYREAHAILLRADQETGQWRPDMSEPAPHEGDERCPRPVSTSLRSI